MTQRTLLIAYLLSMIAVVIVGSIAISKASQSKTSTPIAESSIDF